jgi:hypothetical protein
MFDNDIRRLVAIFQEVFNLDKFDRDQAKYVKRYEYLIERTGQLFEYFSLAKPDKKSPLGWRPTPVLLHIVDEPAPRKSKPSRKSIFTRDRLLRHLLDDTVFGAENDTSCALGYDVLHELALVREDGDGEYALTRRLLRLFDDAYFTRLARRQGMPVPTDYDELIELIRRPGR